MNLTDLLEEFNVVIDTPEGLTELRSLILGLAVRGKLVPQDPEDESVSDLLEKIEDERQRLYKAKEIRKPKNLDPITGDEIICALPSNWEWVKLGNITNQITDGTHHTPNYKDVGVHFLSIKDISSGYLDFSDTRFISREEHEELIQRCNPQNGDILFTRIGTLGVNVVIQTDIEFSIFVSVGLLKFDQDSIYPHFLANVLNSPLLHDQYEKVKAGGSHTNKLNLTSMYDLLIPLPPLAEQHRIVQKIESLFAEVDELEAKLNRQAKLDEKLQLAVNADVQQAPDAEASKSAWSFIITNFDTLYHTPEAIDNLKKNILNEAVRGRLVPQNPNDEPASELLKKIEAEKQRLYEEGEIRKPKKLTPVNEQKPPFIIPESWEWCYFEKLCEIETNLVDPKNYEDYPHIAPNNIEKETGKLLPFNTIKVDGVKSKKHLFKKNRILYSKIRPRLSKLVMVDFIGLCSADMYPLNPYTRIDYFFFYMLSSTFYSQVIKTDTRVAMPKTNQSELNKTLVPLPPLEEQHRIVQRIEELFAICDRFKAQLEQREKVNERLVKGLVQEVLEEASSSEKE